MNLPTGYANLSVLSTFLHENRSTTIKRAKDGVYKTARPFSKAKLEVWIIRQDELFEVMSKHREDVPSYIGRIDIYIKPDVMGTEREEAELKVFEIMERIIGTHEMIDQTRTVSYVEEE